MLDDGDKLRVLPMLGRGSVQNIADLIYLKGIDVAIVHTDALTQTMQRGTIPRENSVQYIAKLFQEEIHILARQGHRQSERPERQTGRHRPGWKRNRS